MHGLKLALCTPATKRLVDVVPMRVLLGQHSPGAARANHIAAGINHQAPTVGRRQPLCVDPVEQIADQRPLRISQATRILLLRCHATVRRCVTITSRCLIGTALHHRPLPTNPRSAKGLADRRRMDHYAAAVLNPLRDLRQGRRRLRRHDLPQHHEALSIQLFRASRLCHLQLLMVTSTIRCNYKLFCLHPLSSGATSGDRA